MVDMFGHTSSIKAEHSLDRFAAGILQKLLVNLLFVPFLLHTLHKSLVVYALYLFDSQVLAARLKLLLALLTA